MLEVDILVVGAAIRLWSKAEIGMRETVGWRRPGGRPPMPQTLPVAW